MKYTTWRCLAPVLAAGVIGCSSPPPAPSSSGSGGSFSNSGGSTGAGGSSSGSGGNTSGSGGAAGGSGGASGSAGSGGATASGGGAGNPDGGGMMGMGGSGGGMAMGCPEGVAGHCSSATYPEYPGMKLALVEDFDQPIDLDKDPVWTWGDGVLTEGAVRMTKNNVTFEGGKMKLTVKKENAPGGRSEAENSDVLPRMLTSGEMRTKFNNYRYGRYEVRLKAPSSKGNFISTLFTFRTPKAINWREVDIELTASAKPIVTNVVKGDNVQSYDRTSNHVDERAEPAGFNSQADFHTYAFEWLPGKVTWYIDGMEWRKYEGPDVPEKSTKIMMNLWVFAGGAFGGPDPGLNQYPLSSEYEWFRFYRATEAEPMYPCSPAPACLPAEDKVKGSQNNSGDATP